ncbi:MAG: caspase family protein [Parvibaculaceae bacterium]
MTKSRASCGLPLFLSVFFVFWFAAGNLTVAAAPIDENGKQKTLDDWCSENNCSEFFNDLVAAEVLRANRIFPEQEIERFEAGEKAGACRLPRPLQPTHFAVVIAPNYQGGSLPELNVSETDVRYFTQALKERAFADERIIVLTKPGIGRADIVKAMQGVLACVRAGDQVLFAFSGHATRFPALPRRALTEAVGQLCGANPWLGKTGICLPNASDSESWKLLSKMYDAKITLTDKTTGVMQFAALANWQRGLDYDSYVASKGPFPGLLSLEIANFVSRVRNLDADAIVFLDANYAALANIAAYSRKDTWRSLIAGPASEQLHTDVVPVSGRGEVAAFYASNEWGEAAKTNMGDLGKVSNFSYAMVEILRGLPNPTARNIAAVLTKYWRSSARPVIDASNPDAVLLPANAPIEPKPDDIELIFPPETRSMTVQIEGTIELIARYAGKGKPFKAIVNGSVVDLDINGQFRYSVDAEASPEVDIRILSSEFATLSHRRVKLTRSDADIIFNSPGRKIAFVIANQDYDDPAIPDLRTPKADAAAIVDMLVSRFGFQTEIALRDNQKLDLVLVNATRDRILKTLFELRKRLTAEDELLIYYAGHGEAVEGVGSFWIPTDGKLEEDYDWIDANDITDELKRLNARAVLVISDSCYSGGLARALESPTLIAMEGREKYLARAKAFRSRQLIASGGDEPVADGDGKGHSIFARALLDGLATMAPSAFTASELLEQKVKPAVVNNPSALSERQIPGFHRISKAGDETSSEFIFTRKKD